MSYCHLVQNNLYNYDKIEIKEKNIDTISSASLQNQVKACSRRVGRKNNKAHYCSVLNAYVMTRHNVVAI